jgi:hypothetical protein
LGADAENNGLASTGCIPSHQRSYASDENEHEDHDDRCGNAPSSEGPSRAGFGYFYRKRQDLTYRKGSETTKTSPPEGGCV